MLGLTRSHVQPIGIDIGHDSIKMLQLEVSGQSLAVRAACRELLPSEARANEELRISMSVDLIRRMLRQQPFRGRQAVVALPRELVQMKNFRLPVMPAGELELAVNLEARQLFGFDLDDAQVQFLPAGEVRQGNDVLQEIIVLAARNADVDNYVEQMHRCGVVLSSLDALPCALFRGVERFIRRRQDELEVHVLVDVGLSGTQVVIGKGRDISFIKWIDLGGRQLSEAVARKLGISYEEAASLRMRLAEAGGDAAEKRDSVRQAVFDAMRIVSEQLGREISLCLRYQSVTFRGHRPTRLRLLGGEARDPQLVNILGSIVPIPVEASRPLYSVDVDRLRDSESRGSMSEWAVALGLGLKRTAGGFAPKDGRSRAAGPLPEYDPEEAIEAAEGADGAQERVAATSAAQEAPHA